MRRDREAYEDTLAIVRQFNARLSTKKTAWFWPTISAALASKHHWLIIACDACDTVIDLDLTVKRRDPDGPIRVALNDVRCPRCSGHGQMSLCMSAFAVANGGGLNGSTQHLILESV